MNRVRRVLVDACVIFTVTAAMLAGLEAAARVAAHLAQSSASAPEVPRDHRFKLEFDWSRQHEADSAGESSGYRTYVEFRENPLRTSTLNIDAEGRRVVPGNCEGSPRFTIMAFGGSTMYGSGVPDQYTIPAYMAAHFKRSGSCVRVVNYGAGWWQSTQSLVQLIEVLKDGERPDAVVFYDGINEINAPALGGKVGGIDPDAENALRLALEPHSTNVLRRLAENSDTVYLARRLLRPNAARSAKNDYEIAKEQRPAVAMAVAETYAGNVRIVDALAREFGFDAYFFLQPCLVVAQRKYSARELQLLRERAVNREWEADFFRLAYGHLRRHAYLKGNPRFRDISGALDSANGEVYMDSEHLAPEGNRVIAERIAAEIVLPSSAQVARP